MRFPRMPLLVPATGPGNDRPAKLVARLRYAPRANQLGGEIVNALTFIPDHPMGTGQTPLPWWWIWTASEHENTRGGFDG